MSGWIKWSVGLDQKPEVYRIAAKLGIDRYSVAGRLMVVWAWADSNIAEPNADGHAFVTVGALQERVIDDIANMQGFAEAMVDAGWLLRTDDGVAFPKFERHNGNTGKNRALGKNRQQKARAEALQPSRYCNDASVTSALPDKIREEKIREESSEDKNLPQTVASPKTRKTFVPPTVEEVAAFFQERGNGLDAEAFVAHYEANGWKQANGNPIKKWQAAVITWEKNREHGLGFKGGVASAQAKTIPKVLPPEFAMTWEEASTSVGLDSWFRAQNVIPRSYENRRLVHSIRFYHLRKIRGDDAERRVANAIYSDLKTWWSGGDWPNLTRIEDWREAEAFIAGLEGAA